MLIRLAATKMTKLQVELCYLRQRTSMHFLILIFSLCADVFGLVVICLSISLMENVFHLFASYG